MEIVQCVKYLPHNCEDLSLDPQNSSVAGHSSPQVQSQCSYSEMEARGECQTACGPASLHYTQETVSNKVEGKGLTSEVVL